MHMKIEKLRNRLIFTEHKPRKHTSGHVSHKTNSENGSKAGPNRIQHWQFSEKRPKSTEIIPGAFLLFALRKIVFYMLPHCLPISKKSELANARSAGLYCLYKVPCAVAQRTPRTTMRADTSIKIQRSHMPSPSSQFGGTREISSEQCQNIAKITKNHESYLETENFVLKSTQVIPIRLLTRYTHIARDKTKKLRKIANRRKT